MNEDRLERQIRFTPEIDELKGVLRQSHLLGVDRRENSAEGSDAMDVYPRTRPGCGGVG